MPKQFMTANEVAEMLRWHPDYVRRLARQGRIPCFKLGREWRFVEETLLEWAAQGQPDPSEQPGLFDDRGGSED